jgi:hypothetical protein
MPSLERGNSLSDIYQLFRRTNHGSGAHAFHEQSNGSGRYEFNKPLLTFLQDPKNKPMHGEIRLRLVISTTKDLRGRGR